MLGLNIAALTGTTTRQWKEIHMGIRTILAAAAATVALALPAAQAGVIYNNGAATSNPGWCTDDSGTCGGSGSWTVFDDFTMGLPSHITGINFTVFLLGGLADFNGAQAAIYSGDPVLGGGTLVASIAMQGGAPSLNALGGDAYDLHLSGLDIYLAAGTYWLGMHTDTNALPATIACSGACSGNATQWQNDGSGVRQGIGIEAAFQLEGERGVEPQEVPEPATLGLLGVGLAAAGWARRRRS